MEPSKLPFGELLNDWLEDKSTSCRESTIRLYRSFCDLHILPALGTIPLSNLSPAHVQRFYTSLIKEKELSEGTVRSIHMVLHMALDRAMKWQLVTRNVTEAVDLPKAKRTTFTVWTPEEVGKFLDAAKSSRHYIAYLLAIMTGMRKGEILALRWAEVDTKSGTIAVRRTMSRTATGFTVVDPKTSSGVRTIAISDSVVAALKTHRAQQNEYKLFAGSAYQDEGYVVATRYGAPVNERDLKSLFFRYIQRAGVPRIRFHDLRHTHASLLLLQGTHPKIVSERLGHANISITIDTYSHLMPGMQEAAAAKLDDTLFRRNRDRVTKM